MQDAATKATLRQVFEGLQLTPAYAAEGWEKITVELKDVNRPGLALTGFFGNFQPKRIQICGMAENSYLNALTAEERMDRLDQLFSRKFPAIVVTTGLPVFEEMRVAAEKYHIPVFTTESETSAFMADLISVLSVRLAPMIAIHGVLVEVYGEGILLLGDSGIGKSETAMELIKRGHRLIADDSVELRRVSNRTLVGTSPEVIRHYIELRGIGIVDVRRIFGMGSIKASEKIDLIIRMEQWQAGKTYERLGMDNETHELLGLHIPAVTIPVRPGRNLAIIIEVAAMNNRQKKMGYNAAEELQERLMRLAAGDGDDEDTKL